MLKNIVSSLISEKKDFSKLMDIYMNTTDILVSNCLKKHFILKNNEPKKIENRDTSTSYIKFSIGPSYLFDNDKYYHKFIKGMLQYLELIFDNNYLYQYIQKIYFQKIDKPTLYLENFSSIINSLNKMSEDMKRVISGESNHKIALQEEGIKKMDKNKYKLYCIQAKAHEINEVLNIYDNCHDNDEIIKKIEELHLKLYGKDKKEVPELYKLKDLIEKYINNEKSKYVKNLEQSISLKDTELYSNSRDIQELRNNIEDLLQQDKEKSTRIDELENNDRKKSKEINELKKNDTNKSKEINELKKKINYIEPIVISLISRKIINYSICKILDNYKKLISIIITRKEGKGPTYQISFLNSVQTINVNDANKLLNTLFVKKNYIMKIII